MCAGCGKANHHPDESEKPKLKAKPLKHRPRHITRRPKKIKYPEEVASAKKARKALDKELSEEIPLKFNSLFPEFLLTPKVYTGLLKETCNDCDLEDDGFIIPMTKKIGGRRKTHEHHVADVKRVHDDRVIVLGIYNGNKNKILYGCKEGHTWYATPNNIIQGKGCPYCASNRKKTQPEHIADVKQVHGDNVIVLGIYINAHTKILYGCKEGHTWYSKPKNILSGYSCPKCSKNRMRTQPEHIADVKQVHGDNVIVLGIYTGAQVKILYGCNKGHTWYAKPYHILSGTGCPFCNGGIPFTHEHHVADVKRVHDDRVIVLGVYTRAHVKILYGCKEKGHTWYATPNSILNGRGCPFCSNSGYSKSGIKWLTAEEKRLKIKIKHYKNIGEHRIPTCNNGRKDIRLDGKLIGNLGFLKVAFEHHGDSYHGNPAKFKPNDKCNPYRKNTPAKTLYKETITRENFILSKGFVVIRIWYSEFIENKRAIMIISSTNKNKKLYKGLAKMWGYKPEIRVI